MGWGSTLMDSLTVNNRFFTLLENFFNRVTSIGAQGVERVREICARVRRRRQGGEEVQTSEDES